MVLISDDDRMCWRVGHDQDSSVAINHSESDFKKSRCWWR